MSSHAVRPAAGRWSELLSTLLSEVRSSDGCSFQLRSNWWCRGAGSNRRHRVFQLIWRMSATVRRRPFRDQLGVRLGGNCPLLSASVRLGRGVRWGSSRQLDTGTQYAESALAQGSDHAGGL